MDSENNQQPQAVVNQPKPVTPQPPKKKSGIGKKILMIILALLVLCGVAYGTYYFTKQQAEEDAAAVIEPLQAQVAELEAKIAKQESTESESAEGSYLEIEQWGVRLTPTESAMSYKITTDSNGNQVAWLTNKNALALAETSVDKTCNKENEDGSPSHWYLTAVTRTKEKLTGTFYENLKPIEIGDYYYYVEQANGTCSRQSALDAEAQARDELYKAALTLEASEE